MHRVPSNIPRRPVSTTISKCIQSINCEARSIRVPRLAKTTQYSHYLLWGRLWGNIVPKIAKTLTAIAVRNLLGTPGRWPVGGAPGLLLQVGDRGAASWLLRVSADGRRRDIGLGSYRVVDLATARDL